MKWFKKYTQAEYESASGSVVSHSVVLAGDSVKFGGHLAISDKSNLPLMDALRANNVIASNKTYLTVEEAGQITSLPNFALFSTGITSMEELRFFTGLTTWGIQIAGRNEDSDCLTNYALPPTITSFANQSLQSRTYVKKLVIPDKSKYGNGVTSLPSMCIKQNYALRLLVLPSTLTSVANDNFNRLGWRGSNSPNQASTFVGDTPCALTVICKALTPPTVNSTNNSFLTHAGSGYDYTGILDLKIYVPDDSVNAYKGATWWTQYSNYIFPLSWCQLKFYDFFEDDFSLPYDSEIEYLESNGTQYIDTGIVPYIDTGIEVTYMKQSTSTDRSEAIFGLQNAKNTSTCWYAVSVAGNSSQPTYIRFGRQIYWSVGTHLAPYDVINTISLNYLNNRKSKTSNTNMIFDFSGAGSYNFNYDPLFTALYSIQLFAMGGYKPTPNLTGRIYGCKITQGNRVIMDLIPVRKGSVGYMYDRATGRFFENLGTGNFILGPDK